MPLRFAGVIPALLPILVAYVSHELIEQLFSRLIVLFTDSATVQGWDKPLVSILALILGAIASGIVAQYKATREKQLADQGVTIASRSATATPEASPFLYGY